MTRAKRAAGMRTHVPNCHHPRKRVIQYSRDADARIEKPRRTGYPAFAGYDDLWGCERAPRRPCGPGRHQMKALSRLLGLQLADDHPLQRVDRLEILGRNLILRNREIEFR